MLGAKQELLALTASSAEVLKVPNAANIYIYISILQGNQIDEDPLGSNSIVMV